VSSAPETVDGPGDVAVCLARHDQEAPDALEECASRARHQAQARRLLSDLDLHADLQAGRISKPLGEVDPPEGVDGGRLAPRHVYFLARGACLGKLVNIANTGEGDGN
jgi:hypothetical protein